MSKPTVKMKNTLVLWMLWLIYGFVVNTRRHKNGNGNSPAMEKSIPSIAFKQIYGMRRFATYNINIQWWKYIWNSKSIKINNGKIPFDPPWIAEEEKNAFEWKKINIFFGK